MGRVRKLRLTTLGPKVKVLPDGHLPNAQRLYDLSQVFDSVGNTTECRRLLSRALNLWRGQGENYQAARTLSKLADANRTMGLYGERIPQAREASQIFQRLGMTARQADSLITLAWLLLHDNQPDVAERMASDAIELLPEKGEEHRACTAHRVLGDIYKTRGETTKAIHHCEVALGITSGSCFKMDWEQYWTHFALMLQVIFSDQHKLEDAQVHVEKAKSHATNTYLLARAMDQQARIWVRLGRLEEVRPEALGALDAFERLGAAKDVRFTRRLLQRIDARVR